MKKNLFYVVAFVTLSAISINLVDQSSKSLTPSQMANLEALTNYEGGPGDVIPCHSSASQDYEKSYVDCSSCTRIEGWKGTGTEARCTTR